MGTAENNPNVIVIDLPKDIELCQPSTSQLLPLVKSTVQPKKCASSTEFSVRVTAFPQYKKTDYSEVLHTLFTGT